MYRYATLSLFCLALQSCALQPQSAATMPESATAATPHKKTSSPPQVVIFVSDDIPAYSEVAKALTGHLGPRSSVFYLPGSRLENLKTIARFKNAEHTQFVSVGLNASIAAKSLANRQLVFCQVFNHQDYGLLSSRHKGVSMLPSPNRIFNTWRAFSPDLTDIGIITGPGFGELIQSAHSAARAYGFTLHHKTVKSDKEYQYAYKKMNREVQGYWVLPDNRILSEHILRDIMNFSVRNSKQVAVFSDELLKLGGLFSFGSDYHEIAHQVIERLDQAQSSDTIPGPDIVYPEKFNLHINPMMSENLNLKIPEQYRKFMDAN